MSALEVYDRADVDAFTATERCRAEVRTRTGNAKQCGRRVPSEIVPTLCWQHR